MALKPILSKGFTTLIALLFVLCGLPAVAKESVSFLINPSSAQQQRAYFELVAGFEKQQPDIKIKLLTQKPDVFKASINKFIEQGSAPADVMLVYAGQQLRQLHLKQRLQSLDNFNLGTALDLAFSATTLDAVSFNDERFAIPFSYYHWGIYFNKALFKRYQLTPPTDLNELLSVVSLLRQKKVVPFSFCAKSPWTILAWLDYLNLRINGLDIHKALLQGQVSFTEPTMQKVLVWWLKLVNAGAFDSKSRLDWQECLPYLYRDLTAMSLMGNFFLAKVPDQQHNKFGFFAFPYSPEIKLAYENVPLDAVVIANSEQRNSTNRKAIATFARYLLQESTQTTFNQKVDKIAPHKNSVSSTAPLMQQGQAVINNSLGYMQYFDRETPNEFAQGVAELLIASVTSPTNQKQLTAQLESLRIDIFRE